MTNQRTTKSCPRYRLGNAGLDDILGGGIDPERMYLFEGQPGSGKTTLALEFLLEAFAAARRPSTLRCRRPNGSCGLWPSAMAGRSRASRSSS